MNNIIRWIKKNRKYIGVGLGCFLFFLYIRFPADMFRDLIERQLEAAPALRGYQITISEMSMSLLPGVKLEEMIIDNAAKEMRLRIRDVHVRFHLLPLLLRKLSMSFTGVVGGAPSKVRIGKGFLGRDYIYVFAKAGNLDFANTGQSKSDTTLAEISIFNGLSFLRKKSPQIAAMLGGVQFKKGLFKGESEVSGRETAVQQMDWSTLQADVRLRGKNVVLVGLIPGEMDLGDLDIHFSSEDGKGSVEKASILGKDLEVRATGAVKFEKAPKPGNINLELRLALPETAADAVKSSLGIFLAPLGLEMKQGKAAYRIVGTIGGRTMPRIVPIN